MKTAAVFLGIFAVIGSLSLQAQCQWTYYNSTNSQIPDDYIYAIETDYNGNIWIGTSLGLVRFDTDSSWTLYNTSTGLPSNYASDIEIDETGNIWVITLGASKYNDTAWTHYNSGNTPLEGDYIHAIEPDNHGNLWFSSTGTKSGGVSFYDGNATWAAFTTNDGLVSDDIGDIDVDINDNVWFSSSQYYTPGISRFDGSGWTTYTHANSVPLNDITIMESDLNGNLWVFSYSNYGVLMFNGSQWINFDTVNSGIISDFITCIVPDKNGNVWFGSFEGVSRFDGTYWQNYTTANGLPSNEVADIAFDDEGGVWFATGSGVARMGTKAYLYVQAMYNTQTLTGSDVRIELYSPSCLAANGSDSLLAYSDSVIQNNFVFNNLEPGNYYIKASKVPGCPYTDIVNSYYAYGDTVFLWELAQIVMLVECDIQYLTINMCTVDQPAGGIGFLSGNISMSGNRASGEPVPGAEVFIEQEPNDEPVMATETDNEGDFSFSGVPAGTGYKLIVDIPGLPLIETWDSLEISTTAPNLVNLNFVVDTGGIYVDSAQSVSLITKDMRINIYPNPADNYLVVSCQGAENKSISLAFIDISGTVVRQTYIDPGKQVSTGDLAPGAYILKVTAENTVVLKKIIIQ
ncbi:MAG: two-component regulator propeller domain-containing protein [Bacteroidota bacterium]